MSTNQSRYKKLVEAYQAAFPDMKKQIQYQQVQKEWKQVKDSPKNYEKLMVSLRTKAAKRKSSQLQWWVRATSMKGTTCLLLSANLITGFFTLLRQDWQNFSHNTRESKNPGNEFVFYFLCCFL